jgi:hypothetical protein
MEEDPWRQTRGTGAACGVRVDYQYFRGFNEKCHDEHMTYQSFFNLIVKIVQMTERVNNESSKKKGKENRNYASPAPASLQLSIWRPNGGESSTPKLKKGKTNLSLEDGLQATLLACSERLAIAIEKTVSTNKDP